MAFSDPDLIAIAYYLRVVAEYCGLRIDKVYGSDYYEIRDNKDKPGYIQGDYIAIPARFDLQRAPNGSVMLSNDEMLYDTPEEALAKPGMGRSGGKGDEIGRLQFSYLLNSFGACQTAYPEHEYENYRRTDDESFPYGTILEDQPGVLRAKLDEIDIDALKRLAMRIIEKKSVFDYVQNSNIRCIGEEEACDFDMSPPIGGNFTKPEYLEEVIPSGVTSQIDGITKALAKIARDSGFHIPKTEAPLLYNGYNDLVFFKLGHSTTQPERALEKFKEALKPYSLEPYFTADIADKAGAGEGRYLAIVFPKREYPALIEIIDRYNQKTQNL